MDENLYGLNLTMDHIESRKFKLEIAHFWNNNPLYGFEIKYRVGSREFFAELDKIKDTEVEYFSKYLWKFEENKGKRVLDVGCGHGWLTKNYSKHGAKVTAIDLTPKAIQLTAEFLKLYKLSADLIVADAEFLPFRDNMFDFVSCSGVLHHTPDTQKAIDEIFRVLKPQSEAVISLYYKGLFLQNVTLAFIKFFMKLFRTRLLGREGILDASSVEDFVRMYDGNNNPLGKAYTKGQIRLLFRNFKVINSKIHFFPKRFIPFLKRMPKFIHRFLDRFFGLMIVVKLKN